MLDKHKIKNIILIDDDEVSNYIAASILNDMDITENIHIFSSAVSALEFVSKQENRRSEKLILLDINMPEMSGFDFLDAYHARSLNDNHTMIAMFLTSSLTEKQKEKAQKYSHIIDRYVEKPLTSSTINQLINTFFQQTP